MIILLTLLQAPQLDILLNMPEFPATTQDAVDILSMLRLRRDHNNYRKVAAEHAVQWCTIQLQILERNSVSDDIVKNSFTHLRALQCELAAATEDLLKSRNDIGTIRARIRSKGFPISSRRDVKLDSVKPKPWESASDVSSVAHTSNEEAEI
jgi:hypothetical protein